MSAKVGSLNVDLTLETARFQQGLRSAGASVAASQKGFNSLGSTVGALGKQIASVGTIFAGSAIVTGLAQAAVNGLKYASSLGEVAKQLGVTTGELQEYRYAASQAGVEQDEMDKALAKLTRTIGDAARGSGAGGKAFKELGINIRDANGNLKTAGALIPEIAGALQKLPSDAERAARMVDIFGRSGQNLAPLLKEGAAGINNLRNAARDAGLVIDERLINNADQAADKLSTLQQVLQLRISAAVAENATEIDRLAQSLIDLATEAGKAVKAWQLWKNALDTRLDQNIVDSWFTSDAAKAAAAARIRGLKAERQEILNPGTRVLSAGGGKIRPPAAGSNKFNLPINAPGLSAGSWGGRPGAPSALRRNGNLGGGGAFQSDFQRGIAAAGGGTELSWVEQYRRNLAMGVDLAVDATNELADKTEIANVRVTKSFKEMADDTLSSLNGLASAIRGGGFLDILNGVIGLGLQLGSIGLFGSKLQANLAKPIPGYAGGTSFHPGGLAIVGERGPELLRLPRGSAVTPNHKLGGGGNTYNISGNLLTPDFWAQIQRMDVAAASAGAKGGAQIVAYKQSRRLG